MKEVFDRLDLIPTMTGGGSKSPDWKVLLLVQTVLLRIWKAVSLVLEDGFLSFGRRKEEGKYQKSVFESLFFRNLDSIPLLSAVSRGSFMLLCSCCLRIFYKFDLTLCSFLGGRKYYKLVKKHNKESYSLMFFYCCLWGHSGTHDSVQERKQDCLPDASVREDWREWLVPDKSG